MPTRLKNLKVKRVALVDEGANPDAYITFTKRKDDIRRTAPEPETADMTADEAQSIVKRFICAVQKLWGNLGDSIHKKDGKTFAEMSGKKDYESILAREIYPMISAMCESAASILKDDDREDGAKEALLKQSVQEFADAFTQAAGNWAKAAPNGNISKAHTDSMLRLRDTLDEAIAKTATFNDDAPEPDAQPDTAPSPAPQAPDETQAGTQDEPQAEIADTTDDSGEGEPPAQRGETDMIFDTDKMTPEEQAQFQDLAKRYGHEAEAEPAAKPEDESDIYKGLNPAVKAELESLRKFREDTEEKELYEVAKRYEILGKKPDEIVPTLKSLKATDPTAFDGMISMLDAAAKQVEQNVFQEIGKRGTQDSDDDWGKIEAAAQEILKSHPGMTRAQATDQACIEHPDLVQAYEKSRH